MMTDLNRVKQLAGILNEEMDPGDMHDALGDAMIAMDQANQSVRAVSDELEKDFYKDESVTEAGGYYTQPVYDMIEKHGIDKVMHKLLTSLDADVIQDFISRADMED
jgi:hypothetical protein